MRQQVKNSFLSLLIATGLCLTGCGGDGEIVDYSTEGGDNPFLDGASGVKADTHYLNPDGIEVEVDVEADIEAPAWKLKVAPATLTQYAMTYLQSKGQMYLESLAEDASSPDRVEWLIDDEWVAAGDLDELPEAERYHFRIKGVNAVLLHSHTANAEVGRVLTAPVPARPYKIMEEAGDRCAKYNSHMTLSSSVYWYLWRPDKAGCDVETVTMTLTVSKVLPNHDSYPEYDRLVEDGKVTSVILFGQIGDTMSESDPGFRNLSRMARNLDWAGYDETDAPLGRRFVKRVNGIDIEIDLYSPHEFSGLSDHANFGNFQKAISEHEIVAYDGHSMLGSSDFWSRPEYPEFYQIYLYGGCLGYEYYVRPIVEGKGGWGNVDIVSSVIAVSADANYYAGPFFAKLETAINNDYSVTWKQILAAIRDKVGDSTFGASGVRENCFSPEGSLCDEDPQDDPHEDPQDDPHEDPFTP